MNGRKTRLSLVTPNRLTGNTPRCPGSGQFGLSGPPWQGLSVFKQVASRAVQVAAGPLAQIDSLRLISLCKYRATVIYLLHVILINVIN